MTWKVVVMANTWLSLLPAGITVAAAVLSKRVLPSLILGLLVGSYILTPSVIGGLDTTIEYVIGTASDKGSLQVLLFLYLFSGLVAIVAKAGGTKAFSEWVTKRIATERGVLFALWATIPVTFIDCAFRIIGAGSVIGPLAEKHKLSKERLAFMLNNTASPVVELIPIATTFVGFNIANIGQGLRAAGVTNQSAYDLLLRAIPFEFFSIVVLLITFSTIYFQWRKRRDGAAQHAAKRPAEGGMEMEHGDDEPLIEPRLINLAVPTLTIVTLSMFFFWWFGQSGGGSDATLADIIAATDPNRAMLVALSVTVFVTCVLYAAQKYPTKRLTTDIIKGGNGLARVLAILVVAWSLGSVSQDLGLADFIRANLGSVLPAWSVPVSMFLIASAVTYFIGSGWATASLMMPFAISLAVVSGSGLPLCVAAVITGGTFGDVTSPVAGMTNMASSAAGADHASYLSYANPYNFAALAIAALLFLAFGFIGL